MAGLSKNERVVLPFLTPSHLGSCSCLGAVLHLRQEDGGHKEGEKVTESINSRLQLVTKAGQYMLVVQADSEDDHTRQSKTGHPCQQLSSLEEI